jgi:glycerol-1-phosphate dehydrogenase [NAD(P)+]
MPEYYFRDLLSRFDAEGVCACSCGLKHVIGAREVIIGRDILRESAGLLEKLYGRNPVLWVLSDGNTEAAAGKKWKSGIPVTRIVSRVLPADPKPVPTLELVHELSAEVNAESPDLLVSIGSGVISDLVKKVSLDTRIPNWCVATAASVDAYSSATSAIRVAGYHEALPTRVSEVILCDLDVISLAPRVLFLSGLGDLLAKFIAHLDWNLSHIMTGERYCPMLADFALGSARKALEAARESGRSPYESARSLTDAGLVSGFAMQALGGSRPAASAEHTIAHFWDMAGAVGNEGYDLHGILVGAASRIVLKGYGLFYGKLFRARLDEPHRLEELSREAAWEDVLEKGLIPFKGKISAEMKGRAYGDAVLSSRLETFRNSRDRILGIAQHLISELAQAVEILSDKGFPFSLDDLGIDPVVRTLPLRNVRLLRNRYTTFDLAYELGNGGDLLDGMRESTG